MDNFAKELGGRPRHSPVAGFAGKASNVAGDLLELAELQTRLAKADASLTLHRLIRPSAALLMSICAALASLPVLALGVSGLLSAWAGWPAWQTQLTVGGCLIVIAAVGMFLSLRGIRQSAEPFSRSAAEFRNNLTWLKAVIGSTERER